MSRTKKRVNPFYALLVVAGVAFCITACAYGMMAFRADRQGRTADESGGSRLVEFLDERGGLLMAGELAVLALATVAAMATDRYFTATENVNSQKE